MIMMMMANKTWQLQLLLSSTAPKRRPQLLLVSVEQLSPVVDPTVEHKHRPVLRPVELVTLAVEAEQPWLVFSPEEAAAFLPGCCGPAGAADEDEGFPGGGGGGGGGGAECKARCASAHL
ncbi:hypothetical protein TYRP_013357 [Tyrophagus putrescentiae]|nr:hypothetical protein TYRP_013357 [Tyrophagus putrescentiae]